MILQKALNAYLARHRDDFRKAQTWTVDQAQIAASQLSHPIPYFEQMRRSQKISVVLAIHMRRFASFSDMGTGKTLVALAFAAYFRKAEGARRFLVLVPNRANLTGWMQQIRKHAPDLKAEVLPSDLAGKLAIIRHSKALLLIDTYAGIARMASCKGSGKKLVPDPDTIANVKRLVDGYILDESSVLGTHDSLQTRVVTQLANGLKTPVLCLSGTPFGRDPERLWPQFRIIDHGHTLGETLGLFRGVFYTTGVNHWGGFEHHFRAERTQLLHQVIAHRSIRFQLDEADLPELTRIPIELALPPEGASYRDMALQMLRNAKGNYQLCKNGFMRLRQISSGFLNVRDEATGKTERLEFAENPKMDWLLSQLYELGDYKTIIFHDFLYSGAMLQRAMDNSNVKAVMINGQVSKTQVEEAYTAFTEGDAQVLLLNSQAGAYGSNLQMARYGIYYESPVPVVIRKQSELRFWRPGSEHRSVAMYDLLVDGTVDKAILEFHAEGANLFRAILNGTHKV